MPAPTMTKPPVEPVPTGCCPPFDPSAWDDRDVAWRDRLFVKEHVHSLFHVPLDFGRRVMHARAQILAAGAEPPQPLMLVDEKSSWGADLFVAVNGPVAGAEMVSLSGRFLTKVFDGPFREVGVWTKMMRRHVEDKGLPVRKLYYAYTTCPSCAKAYGHNYVVLFAEIGPPSN